MAKTTTTYTLLLAFLLFVSCRGDDDDEFEGKVCGGLTPPGQSQSCGGDTFCKFFSGTCGAADEPGVCTVKPQVCPEIYGPVCGCDGLTYANDCVANAVGISIISNGECPS